MGLFFNAAFDSLHNTVTAVVGAVEKLFSLYHISGWEWGNQTVFGREADRIPDVFIP